MPVSDKSSNQLLLGGNSSYASVGLVSSRMFSMEFMTGEFPGQGITMPFVSVRNAVTHLVL